MYLLFDYCVRSSYYNSDQLPANPSSITFTGVSVNGIVPSWTPRAADCNQQVAKIASDQGNNTPFSYPSTICLSATFISTIGHIHLEDKLTATSNQGTPLVILSIAMLFILTPLVTLSLGNIIAMLFICIYSCLRA
jgi:hypothetical protein